MTITALSKEDIADREHPRWRERLGSAGKPSKASTSWSPIVRTGRWHGRDRRNSGSRRRIMGGYWRDEKASGSALRKGWLHTGDVGGFDQDGYLTSRIAPRT